MGRHGLLSAEEARKHTAYRRFEMEQPNDLWQMDFKSDFSIGDGRRCHPLTVLDDHSRFLVGLKACPDEVIPTVQTCLTDVFREFGLPARMLMDNGRAGGGSPEFPYTRLTVWLLRLGIPVSHGRPAHPQTQGKDERLHRTLKAELLTFAHFETLHDCQLHFDDWRTLYNHERPHQALALDTPTTRYQPSSRPFPETLPPLTFPPGAVIRKTTLLGDIHFRGRLWRIGLAFPGYPVGLRYDDFDDTVLHVYFTSIRIATLDLSPLPV